MATTPETSDHTSIKLRIDYCKDKARQNNAEEPTTLQPDSLLPFAGNHRQPMPRGLAFNLIDYIELLDWTGRIIRDDKRGAIAESAPQVLQRLDISPNHWLELSTNFESRFKGIAGCVESVKKWCATFGLTRTTNRNSSKILYG